MRITLKIQMFALAGLMSIAPMAHAGVGGSTTLIDSAIGSGSVDAIVAELERAEYIPTSGAFPAVMKLIDHPSARVREAAGWWMGRRNIRSEVIATATQRLSGQDPVAAANVLDVLRGMKDQSTADLVSAYAAKPLDETSGVAAFLCLGAIGASQSFSVVQAGTTSSMAGVRAQALRAVRMLRAPVGEKVISTGAAFIPLLTDTDDTVRREAAFTIGFLAQGGQNPDASSSGLNALINVVQGDKSPLVRKAAAWAIGEIGLSAGLAALKVAQNDSDSGVRSIARSAQGQIH